MLTVAFFVCCLLRPLLALQARLTVYVAHDDALTSVRVDRHANALSGGVATRVRLERADGDADRSATVVRGDGTCWTASWPDWANLTQCDERLRTSDDAASAWLHAEHVRVNGTRVDVYLYRGSATATRVPLPVPLPAADDDVSIVVDRAWRRQLTHTGFHGLLSTAVASACRVQLVELLPRGVYVDVYQLRALEAFDARRPRAAVADVIDLEVPTYSPLARDFAVRLVADSVGGAARFELPVHGRYQRPHEDRLYTHVALGAPLVFEQCGAQWQLVPVAADAAPLDWRLPNGLLSHLTLVTWGTISTTVLGGGAVVASVVLAHHLRPHVH